MPGRNDPCPCGSGKKYKKCCLAADEAQLQPVSMLPAERRYEADLDDGDDWDDDFDGTPHEHDHDGEPCDHDHDHGFAREHDHDGEPCFHDHDHGFAHEHDHDGVPCQHDHDHDGFFGHRSELSPEVRERKKQFLAAFDACESVSEEIELFLSRLDDREVLDVSMAWELTESIQSRSDGSVDLERIGETLRQRRPDLWEDQRFFLTMWLLNVAEASTEPVGQDRARVLRKQLAEYADANQDLLYERIVSQVCAGRIGPAHELLSHAASTYLPLQAAASRVAALDDAEADDDDEDDDEEETGWYDGDFQSLLVWTTAFALAGRRGWDGVEWAEVEAELPPEFGATERARGELLYRFFQGRSGRKWTAPDFKFGLEESLEAVDPSFHDERLFVRSESGSELTLVPAVGETFAAQFLGVLCREGTIPPGRAWSGIDSLIRLLAGLDQNRQQREHRHPSPRKPLKTLLDSVEDLLVPPVREIESDFRSELRMGRLFDASKCALLEVLPRWLTYLPELGLVSPMATQSTADRLRPLVQRICGLNNPDAEAIDLDALRAVWMIPVEAAANSGATTIPS